MTPATRTGAARAIVLSGHGTCFVLRVNGRSLAPLEVALPDGELAPAVERAVGRAIGTAVRFLGVVGRRDGAPLVAVMVADDRALTPEHPLRLVRIGEVRSRGAEVEDAEHLHTAHSWALAHHLAPNLHSRIRRALELSITHLDTHRSATPDFWGWNQFHDRGDFGLLSTAQALLSHVYTGVRGEFVERPARTLEAQQNPDGGWQVRRSLVASASSVSITESTCLCLLALTAADRTPADDSIRRGIAWLERTRRGDRGWSSSADDPVTTVVPTAGAVRALSGLNRPNLVADGVAWLRAAQRADGGWGSRGAGPESSPAYAAHAVLALLAAGVPADDDAVARGCAYLLGCFRPDEPEPWEPTSYNSLVDPSTSARLEYRHYATPWAMVALATAGYDLSHPTLLSATAKLLELQNPNGTWRSAMIAPDSSALWATHDAVLALTTVVRPTDAAVGALLLKRYVAAERQALLGAAPSSSPQPRRGQWWQTLWMSALTVTVALLALGQLGLLEQVVSSPGLAKLWPALATAAVTVAGAVGPPVLAEEYKIRRQRRGER